MKTVNTRSLPVADVEFFIKTWRSSDQRGLWWNCYQQIERSLAQVMIGSESGASASGIVQVKLRNADKKTSRRN